MRWLALVALLIALSGCSREPSFDARYQHQADQLAALGNAMQQDLDNRIAVSAAAPNAMEPMRQVEQPTAPAAP